MLQSPVTPIASRIACLSVSSPFSAQFCFFPLSLACLFMVVTHTLNLSIIIHFSTIYFAPIHTCYTHSMLLI